MWLILVEILNKQQKQIFWGIFDILRVWWFPSLYLISYSTAWLIQHLLTTSSIRVSLLPVLSIGWLHQGLNASIIVTAKDYGFHEKSFLVTASSVLSYIVSVMPSCRSSLHPFYRALYLVEYLLNLLPRITWQLIYSKRKRGSGDGEHRRTFLIGAGDGGAPYG